MRSLGWPVCIIIRRFEKLAVTQTRHVLLLWHWMSPEVIVQNIWWPRGCINRNIAFQTLYLVIDNYVSIINTIQYNTVQFNTICLWLNPMICKVFSQTKLFCILKHWCVYSSTMCDWPTRWCTQSDAFVVISVWVITVLCHFHEK